MSAAECPRCGRTFARKSGVASHVRHCDPERDALLRREYEAGASLHTLSRKHGKPLQSIERAIRRAGGTLRPRQGGRPGGAKSFVEAELGPPVIPRGDADAHSGRCGTCHRLGTYGRAHDCAPVRAHFDASILKGETAH